MKKRAVKFPKIQRLKIKVEDPNAGVATDEANNGTPTNGENQEVQQAE